MLLEVQTLDIISVNIWQILISLCNLLILFLVIKKFLFAPVNRVFEARRADIDKTYAEAEDAKTAAECARTSYEEKLSAVREEGGAILRDAKLRAERLSEEIVTEARAEADVIRARAEADIAQEKKKARSELQDEISTLSVELAGKILKKEIDGDAQRELIADFLTDLGEHDE